MICTHLTLYFIYCTIYCFVSRFSVHAAAAAAADHVRMACGAIHSHCVLCVTWNSPIALLCLPVLQTSQRNYIYFSRPHAHTHTHCFHNIKLRIKSPPILGFHLRLDTHAHTRTHAGVYRRCCCGVRRGIRLPQAQTQCANVKRTHGTHCTDTRQAARTLVRAYTRTHARMHACTSIHICSSCRSSSSTETRCSGRVPGLTLHVPSCIPLAHSPPFATCGRIEN